MVSIIQLYIGLGVKSRVIMRATIILELSLNLLGFHGTISLYSY
jgi:hypothetical protein